MAFSGSAICTSFKQELLQGGHDFDNDTFKMALYDNSAALTAATTAYTATGELADAIGGYTRPGVALTSGVTAVSGTTAYVDFADASWTSATFTAYGALIYNDTPVGDPAVMVIDFGGAKAVSSGTFTVTMPTANESLAILRLA